MKKKVGIIILVIVVILVMLICSKIYHFIVIKKVYNAIEDFRSESNRYYSVTAKDINLIKEEVIIKNSIVKCNTQKDGIDIYCEWKNFADDEEYSIVFKDKTFSEKDLLTLKQNLLRNLPPIILNVYKNNKIDIQEFLKIKYIIPVEYDNQKCYKLVTDTQILIVRKDTYLPIYFSSRFINSEENSKSIKEFTYEFKVGEVTDEDIALPDLTGYTNISEE